MCERRSHVQRKSNYLGVDWVRAVMCQINQAVNLSTVAVPTAAAHLWDSRDCLGIIDRLDAYVLSL